MFNAIIGVWVTACIFIAFLVPKAQFLKATPAAFFHVPMAVSMLISFMVAAFFGVRWLMTRDQRFDAYSLGFAEAGFAACIVAFITGTIWSKINWGYYWTWDRQQMGVLATLITYAALFSLRGATDDDVKKRNFWAVYAIIGVLVAVFGSYVFRHIGPPSLHPSGTLTDSSPLFKWGLRFCIVGYLLLVIKIALIRAQIESATNRLQTLSWDVMGRY